MSDKAAGPDGSAFTDGLGPAAEADDLTRAIASAWRRQAQRVKYQWPGGCGGYAALQTPEIMAELGFHEAAREVAALTRTAERERLSAYLLKMHERDGARHNYWLCAWRELFGA
jgi:hypothetical protein